MALKGDLADFRVPELLAFLTRRHMTGQLVLQHRGDQAILEFQQGQVVRVTSARLAQRLGELLVARGTLTPQQLARMLERQAAAKKPVVLGALLLEYGLVAQEDLEAVLACQAEQILTQVLTWADGTFAYTRSASTARGRAITAVPVPALTFAHLLHTTVPLIPSGAGNAAWSAQLPEGGQLVPPPGLRAGEPDYVAICLAAEIVRITLAAARYRQRQQHAPDLSPLLIRPLRAVAEALGLTEQVAAYVTEALAEKKGETMHAVRRW